MGVVSWELVLQSKWIFKSSPWLADHENLDGWVVSTPTGRQKMKQCTSYSSKKQAYLKQAFVNFSLLYFILLIYFYIFTCLSVCACLRVWGTCLWLCIHVCTYMWKLEPHVRSLLPLFFYPNQQSKVSQSSLECGIWLGSLAWRVPCRLHPELGIYMSSGDLKPWHTVKHSVVST